MCSRIFLRKDLLELSFSNSTSAKAIGITFLFPSWVKIIKSLSLYLPNRYVPSTWTFFLQTTMHRNKQESPNNSVEILHLIINNTIRIIRRLHLQINHSTRHIMLHNKQPPRQIIIQSIIIIKYFLLLFFTSQSIYFFYMMISIDVSHRCER